MSRYIFFIVLSIGISAYIGLTASHSEHASRNTAKQSVCPNTMLLAFLINSESAGESYTDKLHVGSVVLNRVKSESFPGNIPDVIFQARQFSGTSGWLFCDPSEESLRAARFLMQHGSVLCGDVLYYLNPAKVTNTAWMNRLNAVGTITHKNENHQYYAI